LTTISNKCTYLLTLCGEVKSKPTQYQAKPDPELDTPSIKSQKHAALLSPKCAKSCKISREFERISSSRSSKVNDIDAW